MIGKDQNRRRAAGAGPEAHRGRADVARYAGPIAAGEALFSAAEARLLEPVQFRVIDAARYEVVLIGVARKGEGMLCRLVDERFPTEVSADGPFPPAETCPLLSVAAHPPGSGHEFTMRSSMRL